MNSESRPHPYDFYVWTMTHGESVVSAVQHPTRLKALKALFSWGKTSSREASSEAQDIIESENRSLSRSPYKTLLDQPTPPFDRLPPHSFFIQIGFVLEKPYISRDDDRFYYYENSIKREKVFKIPMVAATSWKGNLRWTATKLLTEEMEEGKVTPMQFAEWRLQLRLLFGPEKGDEGPEAKDLARYLKEAGGAQAHDCYKKLCIDHFATLGVNSLDESPHHKGHLYFYPTHFNGIALEVINPRQRKTRTGTLPIYFECVPAGAKGSFSLLYAPIGLIGLEPTVQRSIAKLALLRTLEALCHMMRTYGFSAKKTSGYGVACEEFVKDQQSFIAGINGKYLPREFADLTRDSREIARSIWGDSNE
ncbi:MAG: CRISPR-associated protein [Candidatus Abyssobacteria bacterium SURF_17]|uniref:CRISPR-associated protein n=1 Tax=Candidatus Abyssobacteria bacterium SURF_17 TaxID=2093361 RepID=A0A419F3C9_9BACT|nr:MAG: CRISPR-associated protein [Candidatus Abyssubacteria bacterium SURF_17]